VEKQQDLPLSSCGASVHLRCAPAWSQKQPITIGSGEVGRSIIAGAIDDDDFGTTISQWLERRHCCVDAVGFIEGRNDN
jgi:hypothetical protein